MTRAKNKTQHTPERMCAVCRNRFPKSRLTRFVRKGGGPENGPENRSAEQNDTDLKDGWEKGIPEAYTLDHYKKRPGRGVYVCDDPQCRKKFAKFRPPRKKSKGDS